MRLQLEALKDRSGYTGQQRVKQGILPVGCVLMRWPVRDGEPEPSGERGQGERQHETVVKTISEEEEETGGGQKIEIRLSGEQGKPILEVSALDRPKEGGQGKHVVEYQPGRR